jgi:hypothetical protein
MTLIWCAGRGRVPLTSAPLADWHGPLACRVVLRLAAITTPGTPPGRRSVSQRRRLPRRNALYRGEHCRAGRVQPDGERPGDKADRWGIYAGLGALAFTGLWQRHQNRRHQLRALQNGPRRRTRPAAAVTRLPILMPARVAPVPGGAPPHVKYHRGGTVTSLTSRHLPPILSAELFEFRRLQEMQASRLAAKRAARLSYA